MKNSPPLDILQMALLASADEPNGGDLAALAIICLVILSAGRIEILKADEAAPVRLITWEGLAHEPAREYRPLDPERASFGIAVVDRWGAKLRGPITCQSPITAKPLVKQPRKPRLLDHLESAGAEHLPFVEALYENRSLGQVKHRAGPEDPDHLTQSYLIVGHRRARLMREVVSR